MILIKQMPVILSAQQNQYSSTNSIMMKTKSSLSKNAKPLAKARPYLVNIWVVTVMANIETWLCL